MAPEASQCPSAGTRGTFRSSDANAADLPARRRREGHLDAIALGDVVFGRAVFEPGWKWSECYDQMLAAEGRVLTG